MKIKSIFALLTLCSVLAGCSTMKVTSERDDGYDFGLIVAYQWIDGPAEILDDADTYINEDIQTALNTELAKRNLREVTDAADAQVQIAYYVKLKEEVEYTAPASRDEPDFAGGFVYSRENSSWKYSEREPDLTVYAVEIGTLTVLVYDIATGERIWKGNLQTKIDRSQSPEQQKKRIQAAAEKLMARFPAAYFETGN